MAKLIIRHPRTGHEVGIDSGDFRRRKLVKDKAGKDVSYEEAGYRIVSQMDGSPFQQPKTEPKAES